MRRQDKFDLERFLPYVTARFAGRLSATLATLYQREFGLTIVEWRVMANLYQHDRLLSKEIVARTDMDKVKVSRAVQSLLDKKWLKKVTSPSDNRAYYVTLTASGQRTMQKLLPRVLQWQSQLLATTSNNEVVALLRTIEKLNRQLENMATTSD